MVVMKRWDYFNKALQLLADTNTYKPIHKDPTGKLKRRLAQMFRDIKSLTLSTIDCTPSVQFPPNSMVYPKYTRLAPPQSIVSNRGPITYGWPRN